jgi:hypothetical protein
MRFLAAALCFLLLLPTAWAEHQVVPPPGLGDVPPPPPPPGMPQPPPGGIAVSPDGRLIVSSTVCDRLGPEADVPGADYTPGVDVRGEAVAPADLPGSAPSIKAEDFPIEIDAKLRRRFGVDSLSKLFRSKAIVGYVTVQDGRAFFNGEPIGGNERDMILAACRAAKR